MQAKVSSLRDFLEDYSRLNLGEVFIVEEETNLDYEPSAYYKILEQKNPIIWFKKIRGYPDFEFVTNVIGSEKRAAYAFGVNEVILYETIEKILSELRPTGGNLPLTDSAPIKEVILTGADVDLSKLPIPRHYPSDGAKTGHGRYVSSALAVARNPANPETINLSYTRAQIISPNRYAFDMGSRGHFSRYVELAKSRNERLPVSIIIGAHPIFYLLAASFTENEFSKAMRFQNFTFTSGVKNDIPIPADAEIVLEAEVIPDEEYPEGPFSEFTGYVSKRTTGNVAEVKSILRRSRPIYYDIQGANSNEHVSLFSIPRSAAVIGAVKKFMPPGCGYRVVWPNSGARFLALCSIDRAERGLAKQVGLALIGLDALFSKIAIVIEGESEISFEKFLVDLAVGVGGETEVSVIPEVFCIRLEPSSDSSGVTGKMIVSGKSFSGRYEKIRKSSGRVELVAEGGRAKVVLSHEEASEGDLNIILGSDVDLSKENEVAWAFATRIRPDKDFEFLNEEEGGRRKKKLVFRATHSTAEIPKLPADLIERVAAKINSR